MGIFYYIATLLEENNHNVTFFIHIYQYANFSNKKSHFIELPHKEWVVPLKIKMQPNERHCVMKLLLFFNLILIKNINNKYN